MELAGGRDEEVSTRGSLPGDKAALTPERGGAWARPLLVLLPTSPSAAQTLLRVDTAWGCCNF